MQSRVLGNGFALVAAAAALVSCSSDDNGSSSGETGGAFASGGSGGKPGSGGATSSSGGATASGGSRSGGASASGGTFATGGTASGGESAGGSVPDAGAGGANTGGTSSCTPTTTSINDAQFAFQGTWDTSTGTDKFDGDDHYSSSTGATATVHFSGTGVALHTAKASHHGIAEVRLDGAAAIDVDEYAANRGDDLEVWTSGALAAGNHTLEIRVSGRQNAASSGTTIAVDRVVFQSTSCSTNTGGASSTGGATATGGTTNTGGTTATGGTTNTGGTSATGGTSGGGTVKRPSYNTGPGFFVVGNKLYDANGNEFRIRGVNKLHYDESSPGIPKTHANTERWNIYFTQTPASNKTLLQTASIDNHIVPMPGNWDGTCHEEASYLTAIVDTWVAQAATWKTLDKYMILNIANEWGPADGGWKDAYVTAISRLRQAGYLGTISVTAGGCGQSNESLVNYAKDVFDSDPQKNVIFDQHIYGNWANGNGQSWQTDLKTGLDKLATLGVPIIVGEFGPGRNIGPSPTDITPEAVMQMAEAHGFGWLAWAWDDPAHNADDTWFALSKNGDYDSSDDLTTFGKAVVENSTYGLLKLAKPATIF